jgi:branched-chain amino acid aminotransferase
VIKIGNLSPERTPSYSLAPEKIEFGRQCTPNFLLCKYRNGKWDEPCIEALHNFSMHPASNVFQYGQAVFEGLKAYRQPNDRIVLFRPEMNAMRFEESANRIGMPPIGEEVFLEASRLLVDLERSYTPEPPGTLYLRPTMIGTEASLGVRAATEFLFYIITLPSGAYFKEMREGTAAVRVFVEQSTSRAAPGGTGAIKAAANYAVTLKSIRDAKAKGCSQVLFLDATRRQRVEELGGMNVFFVRNGELITPRLNGTILPGVTRDSLLTLGPDLGIPASEIDIDIDQVVADVQSGAITEALACGTAATIVGISELLFEDGRLFQIGDGQPGIITKRLFEEIQGIQFGRIPDRFGWTRDVSSSVLAASETL